MTNGRSRVPNQWIYTTLILLAAAALVYVNLHRKAAAAKDQVHLELKPIQVNEGWGYLILQDDHVFIRQTIIPAIQGAHPFRTREDAMAVGQKVFDRLSAGQMPIVTVAELKAMGIRPDSSRHDSVQRK
ncbi:MAG: DUF4907 domain-containing protein [Bacteroidota bacterium]|nr:DUF4907 domain-containing protein [Bacteroidota bacterium]MDP4254482.1 DUF4907 domain-containing protein [Bacteroidota bacterium]MDP4257212.1 DUF4907 domain-containing protein [Bacteroidota bacterium]